MVKFMKKQFLYKIFFAAVILVFAACKDPVYFNISEEEKMLDPLIEGSPTNFVEFKDYMYVASGMELYRYEGTNPTTGRGNWKESRPGGKIFTLAVTNNNFYALCLDSSSGKKTIKVFNESNGSWIDFNGYDDDHKIQEIAAAGDQLFVQAGDYGSYYILSSNNHKIIETAGYNMLNGAAYNSGYYFLSAKDQFIESGGNIYRIAEGNLSSGKAENAGSGPFVGIVNIGFGSNPVKAINRDGRIFNVTSESISSTGTSMGNRLATGALAVWKKDGNLLLLAGRQDVLGTTVTSGYSYGYMEVGLTGNGDITGSLVEPGINSISSVIQGDNGRYRSTIGRYPVNHIFQASDGTLFASTQTNGIYSYRDRKNIGLCWNAEE